MPSLYLPVDHTDADLVLAGQVAERMAIARDEMAAAAEFGHVIVNDDLNRAAADLTHVIRQALQEERP